MIFDLLNKAKEIFFDKSKSSLKSNNVQDALDEIVSTYGGQVTTLDAKVTDLTSRVGGSYAYQVQTLSSNGASHGANKYEAYLKYNVDSDGCFKWIVNGGNPTKVDYACGLADGEDIISVSKIISNFEKFEWEGATHDALYAESVGTLVQLSLPELANAKEILINTNNPLVGQIHLFLVGNEANAVTCYQSGNYVISTRWKYYNNANVLEFVCSANTWGLDNSPIGINEDSILYR